MLAIGGKSSVVAHVSQLWPARHRDRHDLLPRRHRDDASSQRTSLSKTAAHYFLINYAIGGISGWPIDLKREGNATDMFVDWVRVYSGKPAPVVETLAAAATRPSRPDGVGLNFSVAEQQAHRVAT